MYDNLNSTLNLYCLEAREDGRIAFSNKDTPYFDVEIEELSKEPFDGLFCGWLVKLGIKVIPKRDRYLTEWELAEMSGQAGRFSRLMDALKERPATMIKDMDKPVELTCENCKCWHGSKRAGTGTCSCGKSESNGFETVWFHPCDLN